MELAGLCAICGQAGQLFTCHLCGKMVCRDHYDMVHHACTDHGGAPRIDLLPSSPRL